ncbi:MAG: hypothetical protein ACMUJM_15920 [bacterium]
MKKGPIIDLIDYNDIRMYELTYCNINVLRLFPEDIWCLLKFRAPPIHQTRDCRIANSILQQIKGEEKKK